MTKVEDYRAAVQTVRPDIERAGHGQDWAILRREPNRSVWWVDWIAMGDFLPLVWRGTTAEEAADFVNRHSSKPTWT